MSRSAVAHGLLGVGVVRFQAAVVILDLLFVLLDLTVELVGQAVDRRVQILLDRFDVDVLARKVNGDFGFFCFSLSTDRITLTSMTLSKVTGNPLKFLSDIGMDRRVTSR